jgi:hypothetical protein
LRCRVVAPYLRAVRKKYPLEPLLKVRGERVERRTVEHAGAARRSEHEKAAASAARARRAGAEQASAREQGKERARLARGEARAADLQQVERYRVGAAKRVSELATGERDAERRARAAEEARGRARQALAEAHAAERATVRHAERFRHALERKVEGVEEEAASEHWAAVRRGARRG